MMNRKISSYSFSYDSILDGYCIFRQLSIVSVFIVETNRRTINDLLYETKKIVYYF